jgi:DDE superfamily endonuclease
VPATLPCSVTVPQSGLLAGFREAFYGCLTRRADALFCLGDAVLCAGGRVTDLARLSLVPEFGRGHGALYDALNAGRADTGRLRRLLAGLPLPAWPDGRVRLAVDVTFWLRPDAEASPQRMLCRVKTRRGAAESVPGWPCSFVAALGPGPSSWVVPLDAVRIGPGDDPVEVTAAQLRGVVTRLAAAGHWKPGSPPVVIAADAGYSASRLAWLLRDLPVVLAVRVRADRCWRRAPAPKPPGTPGRPRRHGPALRCADPATWDGARQARAASPRCGPLQVLSWPRLHQKLEHGSGGWDAPGPLPDIPGTLIRLSAVTALPGYAPLDPMWIWTSDPDAAPAEVAVLWQAYLRRFDLEHFFRFIKSQLGWNKPLLRDPAAADRWTWLVLAAYAQLHLARPLAAARLPWQPPLPPAAVTPGRVRTGFRRARTETGTPASPPKPATPGPGRPPGSKNRSPAPRPPVGKTHLKPVTQRINAQRQAKKQRKGG